MRQNTRVPLLVMLGIAMVLSSVLSADVSTARSSGQDAPVVNCDPPHHTAAPFLSQMVGSDEARVYANMAQTIIIAMKIAQCGNRWFFVLYYEGKFHTNFFPSDGWNYISRQVSNYGLSLIPWRNVVINSLTSITVLSLSFFFPSFIFIPWISPGKLYGIPEPTVTAVEASHPVILQERISPIGTPSP
jgi:hypothetical protein